MRARGFTLIELMVTLAVAAIVISMAVPSFQSVINGNKLTAAANEMIASLQLARMEAIRRNARAGVCASTNTQEGEDATCASAGMDGWITFVDANGDGDFDTVGDSLLRTALVDDAVVLTASPAIGGNTIMFRPDGMARDEDSGSGPGTGLLDAVLRFCIPTRHPVENARDLEIGSGSRVAVGKFDGGGACDAPDDP